MKFPRIPFLKLPDVTKLNEGNHPFNMDDMTLENTKVECKLTQYTESKSIIEKVLDAITQYKIKHVDEEPGTLYVDYKTHYELCRTTELLIITKSIPVVAEIFGVKVYLIPWYENQMKVAPKAFVR